MNYSYEIENKSLGFPIVIETTNNKLSWSFSFNQLKRNTEKNFIDHKHLKSYLRTKNWILKNHPELML